MHRILFHLPSLSLVVRSYTVMTAIAVVLAVVVTPRWAAALEGLDRHRTQLAALILAPLAFVIARLHFMLAQPEHYAGHWRDAVLVWPGAIHGEGAVLGLALAMPLVVRWVGLPLGKFADGAVPGIALALASIKVGCFLQGCCFGEVCAYPWCVAFPASTYIHTLHVERGILAPDAPATLPIHPVQLYAAGAWLGLAGVALWLRRHRRFDGQVALVCWLAFSITSALLEALRAEDEGRSYLGPWPQLLWIDLGMAIMAAGLLFVTTARGAGRGGASPPRASRTSGDRVA